MVISLLQVVFARALHPPVPGVGRQAQMEAHPGEGEESRGETRAQRQAIQGVGAGALERENAIRITFPLASHSEPLYNFKI